MTSHPAGWVAVKTCLSPKIGGGWHEMYWSAGSDGLRRTWAPLELYDPLVFDTRDELEAALVETFGQDWGVRRYGEPVRLELLGAQDALF